MKTEYEQTREKSEFLCLLPRTLETVCGMRAAPHDDTIMHRLLDTIQQHILSTEDAHSGGLFQFLNTVLNKLTDINTHVTVLALGIASHVLTTVNPPDEQQQAVLLLYDAVKADSQIQDSSVAAAFFASLALIVERGKLLEHCNNHLHAALDKLEHAQSIFLLKAVENFVASTVIGNLNNLKDPSAAVESASGETAFPDTVRATLELCIAALGEMSQNRTSLLDSIVASRRASTFHQSVVHVVSQMSECKKFCFWAAQDWRQMPMLLHLAHQHPAQNIRLSALSSLVNISGWLVGEAKERFFMKEIVPVLLKLGLDGEVERAVVIAHAFVSDSKNNTSGSEALFVMEQFCRLPSDVLFGWPLRSSHLEPLVPMVALALADSRHFGRLFKAILLTVKTTKHGDGLIRLVKTASASRSDSDWFSFKSAWPVGVGDVIIGNQKILLSLLQFLENDDTAGLTLNQSATVLRCLLNIMKRPLVESQLYSQTCAAFLAVLDKLQAYLSLDQQQHAPKVMCEAMEVIRHCMVAVQWEVRDTTLEFIKNLTGTRKYGWLLRITGENHLLRDAWSCVKDGESYPRASAVLLATSLARSDQWWGVFLQDCGLSEANLVDQIVDLLFNDSEAFPRRAAIEFLSVMYCRLSSATAAEPEKQSLTEKICTTMVSVMYDFDWEVKLKALEFWEIMAEPLLARTKCGSDGARCDRQPCCVEMGAKTDEVCQSKLEVTEHGRAGKHKLQETAHHILQDLLNKGFGKAASAGADDYDSAVKQKALKILARVLEVCGPSAPSASKIAKSDCSTVFQAPAPSSTNASALKGSDSYTDSDEYLRNVRQLDPSHQLEQLGNSCDEYDHKPFSLLEDVIAAVASATAAHDVMLLSEDEFEDADDMFVDCY